VRILRDSSRPKDNLTGTDRRALRDLRKNTDLTILQADEGNVTVVLNNVDYNHKIGALLQDPAYRRLAEGPTETVEHKTTLLFKRSTFAEEVCKQLHPMGMKLPRLYGLCKIPKEGVPIRPTVNNIGAPTYKQSKYLARLLSPLVERSSWHMTNSTEFVHSLGSLRVGLEDLMVSFYAVSLYTPKCF